MAGVLCPVHRRVGVSDEVDRTLAVIRVGRNADTRADVQLVSIDFEPGPDRLKDPFCDTPRRLAT